MIEIRIGVHDSPKEISLELEESSEDLIKRFNEVLAGTGTVLWMTDRRGKQIGIPATKVSYIEIDPEMSLKSVGFARAGKEG